jgi:hypothetical protein
MPYRSIYTYAWDLAPEFDRLLEEQELSDATIALSYHAGKFLRTRSESNRVYFPEDGVVYFEPTFTGYGKIKPIPHPNKAIRNATARFSEETRLSVNAWVVLFHNTRLGTIYPDETVRNAWGDPYLYSLCPVNRYVTEYGAALVSDIAKQFPLSSIVLETPGFLPYAHGYHHEFAQIQLNRWVELLLGLCFCESCLAASHSHIGVQGERLRNRVRHLVDSYVDSPIDISTDVAAAWIAEDLVEDPELLAFVTWRTDRVATFVKQLRSALPKEIALAVIPTIQRPTASCWIEGSDLRKLAEAADYLEIPFYEPSAAAAIADAWDSLRRVGGNPVKIRAILRPGNPDLSGGEQTMHAVEEIAKLGIRDFAFYNFGLLKQKDFARIGPALRNAFGRGERKFEIGDRK